MTAFAIVSICKIVSCINISIKIGGADREKDARQRGVSELSFLPNKYIIFFKKMEEVFYIFHII